MEKPLSVIISLLFISSIGYCQNQPNNVKYNTKEELVAAFVKAVNDNSVDELKQLIHPLCLKAISADNEDYYRHSFENDMGYQIPGDYKASYAQMGSNDALPFGEYVVYPVRPSWRFQLDYNKSEFSSVSIVRWVVNDDSGWHLIDPQPKQELLNQFRAGMAKEAQRQVAVERSLQLMDKDLYAKIVQYLKDRRSIDAIHEYQNRSGESLTMSKSVVGEIRKREKLD
jgi:hypothetical protein